MPHEVAGFAGGAKYFFPGVAGPELTHLTHWLGALATIERVIGRVETPTRHVIEAAADRVTTPVIAFTSVVDAQRRRACCTHALFTGGLRETVRQAAAVSAQVHIRYTGRRYRRVVALLDEHYDELWVGGKASYKLGGIIEDGGELVIYAPHLKGISTTHGAMIEKYGYAPLEHGPRDGRRVRRAARQPVRRGAPGARELRRPHRRRRQDRAALPHHARVGDPRRRLRAASSSVSQSAGVHRPRSRAPRSRHARRRARRARPVL